MSIKNRILLSSIIVVLMLFSACMPSTLAQAPELPGGPVPLSEEAARRLENKVMQAFAQNPTGQFTVRLTDEEVTSWIAYRVANQPGSKIEQPQIRFTQGKVFTAVTVAGILPFKIRTKLVASINVVDDRVQFKVEKSSAGPFPVPGIVLDYLSQTINQTLVEAQLQVAVTAVDILESEIAITGHLR